MRRIRIHQFVIAAVVAAAPLTAGAEDRDWGMPGIILLDGRAVRPLAGGPVAYGAGLAMSVVPRKIPGYFSVNGGFAVTPRSASTRTDTFGFGVDFGVKPELDNGSSIVPYAGASIRVLAVSRYTGIDRDRFTTFAIGATAGVMGDLPGQSDVFYRAGAVALAANTPDGVPGTSLVVTLGLGTRFGF